MGEAQIQKITFNTMKTKNTFKQFAKDCPEHFSMETLQTEHLEEVLPYKQTRKEKSTRNSKIQNKF